MIKIVLEKKKLPAILSTCRKGELCMLDCVQLCDVRLFKDYLVYEGKEDYVG